MYIYFVRHAYREGRDLTSIKLDSGVAWEVALTHGRPVLVHPDLDYHQIWGDLFLRNDTSTKLVALEPDEKVTEGGVFILARNFNDAKELL